MTDRAPEDHTPGDQMPEDRELSPSTGWTRAHWEDLADRLLLAVRPYASDHHALVDLPGPASRSGRWSDGLEGFARTFLAAGFRLARSGDEDPHDLAGWYAEGLAAGTDPDSPERWPYFSERFQANVECASIALALHESRAYVWERLDARTQENVVAWMARMVGTRLWDNNWRWFQVITEAFLRSVGGPWRAEDIDATIARTEQWYAGDGWYSDGFSGPDGPGARRNFDYYSGWAMQFYPLWYFRIAGADADPALLATYRGRLRRYLEDLQHFVAADGSPVFQGRSLTYRYAMTVPFWVGEVFDASPLPAGRTRRLTSAVVRRFLSAGSLDEHGLQTLGWHRRFEPMRQEYSGPGSPYWSSKAFAGLVLPASHPAWAAREEPLEVERRDVSATIRPAGFVVSATRADGIVRITNHRGDHNPAGVFAADDPAYSRLAYASHAAPDYGELDAGGPIDSSIAVLGPDGRGSLRRPFELLSVEGNLAISRHRAHWPEFREHALGPWVTVGSLVHAALEIRVVRLDPALESPDGPGRLRFGGWSLAADQPTRLVAETGTAPAGADSSPGRPDTATITRDDGLVSSIRFLRSVSGPSPVRSGVRRLRRTNPFGPASAVPWIATEEPVAAGDTYAVVVALSGVPVDMDVRLDPDGAGFRVTWPDGTTDAIPELPSP